ncbi:hypothetical protein FOVSG1_004140 [Fusarium oxysporum f. sp. vasinfectum]
MGAAPLSLTFLCQGFAFSIPQSIARAQSPKLAASLDAAQKISQNPVVTVKEFSLDTVNCMVEFFKSGCYEVDRRNFPSVLQAVGGAPAAPDRFMRDELTCHLQICAIGTHYGVPKLCELARDNIQKVFGGKWFDSAFLFTVAVVLKSKDDKLQRLLVTLARGHLHSLTTSNGFDHATMLRSFHPKFRDQDDILQQSGDQPKPTSAPTTQDESSTKLEALCIEVSSLKQQVTAVSCKRDELRDQFSAASVKKEELWQSVATLAAERDLLRNELSKNDDLKKSLELERRSRVSITEFARDDVRNALKDEQKVTTDLTARLAQASQALETERNRSATLVQELTQAKRNLESERQSNTGMSLSERDRIHETIGSQRSEISALVKERDEIKRELKMARAERNNESDRKWEITNKMNALIQAMDEWDECRHCGADFGTYVEDHGSTLVLRCHYCTTRHWA